ncbi:hypothetical protein HHL11_14960 [Ramlibacter sp. G-1-2-2]|uniref:Bacterial Ig-like domain-containing protein n=1 Tax=Ramlibacter agri TaxID=2728837 RepID=A0A848H251_9BURK|nr:hypothetical protein [Ramlibacter agri]NML45056.1 hypothetical protein [Ramlibacter agri]
MKQGIAPSLLVLLAAVAAVQPVLAQPSGGRDWEQRDERSRFGRDERPPQIGNLAPGAGQVVPPGPVEVSARLFDQGSGVDPRSVRLRLNGRDVTDDARVNAGEVRLRTDLRPGRYTAEVVARDNAGNPARATWSFEVASRPAPPPVRPVPPIGVVPPPMRPVPPIGVVPPGVPMRLMVTSHQSGATISRYENVQLLGQAAPGSSVRIEVDNQTVVGTTERLLDETTGADGSGTFRLNFSPTGFVQPGVRYDIRITSGGQEQRLVLFRR